MINYISENRKILVTRNNGINKNLLCLEYDVEASLDFQIVDSNNQLVHIDDNLSGLYLAVGLKLGEPSRDLLALSKDYTISNDTIHFSLQTYTENWLNRVRKASTEAYFELGQMSLNQKRVIARDYCYVWPRCYIEGLSPQEIDSNAFYNKTEVNELVDAAEAELKTYADEKATAALTESKSYTDEQISALDLSQYATDAELAEAKTELDGKINSKQDKITSENKLPYSLISDTPTIPTKTSELTNDSTFQTAQDVQNAISGKADTSALTAHTSDTTIHVTAADKTAWNGKLDPSALNGYATEQYVDGQVSGKADKSYVDEELAKKQDKITAENKLGYDLLSGTPDLSVYALDSDLQIVSGAVDTKLEREFLHFYGTYIDTDNKLKEISIGIKKTIDDPMLSANFEYSLDFGKSWHEYSFNGISGELITGHHIMFRGDNPNGIQPTSYRATSCHYQFYQSNDSYEICVRGNPYSLLSKEIREELTGDRFNQNSYQFAYLFKDMNRLVDASNLFLPQFVHNNWFESMFENCTALKHPPKFKKFFPRLDNTRNDCVELFKAMFKNTYIAETPEIHIIQYSAENDIVAFGHQQCNEMFSDCRNLNKVNLIIDIKNYNKVLKCLNSNFTGNWLYNVPASGTFCCSYGLDTSIRDASHIPVGWDVVYTDVPESVLSGAAAAAEALTMING